MTRITTFSEGRRRGTEELSWFKISDLRLALGIALKFYTSVEKGKKYLWVSSYVCRSNSGKTGREAFFSSLLFASPLFSINRFNLKLKGQKFICIFTTWKFKNLNLNSLLQRFLFHCDLEHSKNHRLLYIRRY